MKLALVLLAATSSIALADQNDGKPYDWSNFTSIHTRNARQESMCDRVATNLEIDSLTCSIDHASWDAFAKADHDLPLKKRSNGVSPWSCQGALQFFRNYSENGHFPDSRADGGGAVIVDTKAKLKSLNCVVDNVDKPDYLTYDAKKKELTFHITRAPVHDSGWVGDELQNAALKKVFVGINKYWDDGHNM
jgi:hypothetical protein